MRFPQVRTWKLRRWVAEVMRRCFPWWFRGKQTPIIDTDDTGPDLRHRSNVLELEQRRPPTILSVATLLAPPAILMGNAPLPAQSPPAETPGRGTVYRPEGEDSAPP